MRLKWRPLLGVLFFIALTLSLSACFTVGKSFPDYAVPDIMIDKTIQAELRTMFGPPW